MGIFWIVIQAILTVIATMTVVFVSTTALRSAHKLSLMKVVFAFIHTFYPCENKARETGRLLHSTKGKQAPSKSPANRVSFAENHEDTPDQAFEPQPECPRLKSILKRSATVTLVETPAPGNLLSQGPSSQEPMTTTEPCSALNLEATPTRKRRLSIKNAFMGYSIQVVKHNSELVDNTVGPSDEPDSGAGPAVQETRKSSVGRFSGLQALTTLSSDGESMLTIFSTDWLTISLFSKESCIWDSDAAARQRYAYPI